MRYKGYEAIVEYEAMNKEPDNPYSGKFNLRLSSDIHRRAAIKAERGD